MTYGKPRAKTANGLVLPDGLGDEQDDINNWTLLDKMLSGTNPDGVNLSTLLLDDGEPFTTSAALEAAYPAASHPRATSYVNGSPWDVISGVWTERGAGGGASSGTVTLTASRALVAGSSGDAGKTLVYAGASNIALTTVAGLGDFVVVQGGTGSVAVTGAAGVRRTFGEMCRISFTEVSPGVYRGDAGRNTPFRTRPTPIALLQSDTIVETRKLPRKGWWNRMPSNPLIDLTAAPSGVLGSVTHSATKFYSAGMGYGGASTGIAGTASLVLDSAGTYYRLQWNGSWAMPADGHLQLLALIPDGVGNNWSYKLTNSTGGSATFAPKSGYTKPGEWNVLPIWATNDTDVHTSMMRSPGNINVTVASGGISAGDTITQVQIEISKSTGTAYTFYFTPIYAPPKIRPIVCLTIDSSDASFESMCSIMSAAKMKFGMSASNNNTDWESAYFANRLGWAVAAGGEIVNGSFSRAAMAGLTEAEVIKEYVLTEQKFVASNLPVAHEFATSAANAVPPRSIRKTAYPKLGKRFIRGQGLTVSPWSPIGLQETTNMGARGLGAIDELRKDFACVKKLGGVLFLFGHAIKVRAGDPESALPSPSDSNYMWTEDFQTMVTELMADHAAGNLYVALPSELGPILDGLVTPEDLT